MLGARRGDALAEVAREIEAKGGRAAVLAGDVRDEGFAAGLVALALERFGGLDVALNNAGALGALGPAESLSPAGVRETLEVNLLSAFAAVRHQAAPMLARGGGSMIFTSSFVGHTVGMPGMAAYAASKAGLVGLAKVLAAEYGPRGLRVNALLPGGTDTDMATEFADDPQKRAFVENLFALKRIAAPERDRESRAVSRLGRREFRHGDGVPRRWRRLDQPHLSSGAVSPSFDKTGRREEAGETKPSSRSQRDDARETKPGRRSQRDEARAF